MKTILIVLAFIVIQFNLKAQKDRYRFAATYFGIESEFSPTNLQFNNLNSDGVLQSEKLPTTITPRILIGATHFWNRADFYISFGMGEQNLNGSKKAKISNGVLTGFRLLPFELKQNRFRPFFGIGFNNKTYQQKGSNGQSQVYSNWQWFYEAGITYLHKKRSFFGLEARYFSKSSYNVYSSITNAYNLKTTPYSFSLTYKFLLDFSASYGTNNSKKFFTQLEDRLASKKQLNTYSIGLGVSALIPLEKSVYASQRAFLNDKVEGQVFPEVGLAYYHQKLDASIRISYRQLVQKENAYHYEYQLRNNSIALETFKFIYDFHGFVPFVGPYLSKDYYRLKETEEGIALTNYKKQHLGYGLVFGWDIRFTKVDHITLRTNLRYTPNPNLKFNGHAFTNQQIEFNFIQVVYYPQRAKNYKSLIKQL